jgi:hypothetical protein
MRGPTRRRHTFRDFRDFRDLSVEFISVEKVTDT